MLRLAADDPDSLEAVVQIIEAVGKYKPKYTKEALEKYGGYCHAWCNLGILGQVQKIQAESDYAVSRVDYITPKYTGWIPRWQDHGLIRITLSNGEVFYLDKYLQGKSDHISFKLRDDLHLPGQPQIRQLPTLDPMKKPWWGVP